MLRTLRSRLLLTYLLVIGMAISVIAIVTLVYLARNPSQIVQARYRLQVDSEAIARRAAAISREADLDFRNFSQRLDESFDVRVMLFRSDGELILDLKLDSQPRIILPNPTRIDNVENPIVKSVRDQEGAEWLYLGRRVENNTWLVVATPHPTTTLLASII